MTKREELIEQIKYPLNISADITVTEEDANQNIKALEQESVLDKIRAEIIKLQTYKMFEGEDTVYVERDDVLEIIDKYKESEV